MDKYRPLIENLLKDFIFGKTIEELDKKEISIGMGDPIDKKIIKNKNGCLDYQRNQNIVAMENKFAREIVLREMYFLQSAGGEHQAGDLQSKCHYYDTTLESAISALVSKKYLEYYKEKFLRLTLDGMLFVENQLLQYFTNKIFLIAACNEDIYEMIDKVYKPAVENEEIGCELVFQERSEPKGSLHDEIWENIERCKLTICDLTGSRPNCLIEYGYALAKDKRIILCIEESEGKNVEGSLKVPFDTLTQKFSFWKSEWLAENNEKELNKFKEEIKERVRMKINIINEKSEI